MSDLEKPYIKKYSDLDGFEVYTVDGKYIRDHIDREFTNFGQHFEFPFIPKNEFWLDREYAPGEADLFIDQLIVLHDLMSKGVSIHEANKIANKKIEKERKKSEYLLKVRKHDHKKIPTKLYVDRLETYSVGLDVWIVSGELVRDLFYTNYTEGGHEFVYDFVPENEVWIDDDLSPAERPFVILHELHERNLMKHGMKYDSAHLSSSIIEYKCRRAERDVHEEIQKELKLNMEES